ncbi:MAG: sulfur carrier protein ThiS [Oxalobacteraceae bacterium]|jgi:sulfur carrier protein|nr:sulfur carrier protein ThiS [Oxalobacteraceae bacterium]
MSATIAIELNGEVRTVSDSDSVQDLIDALSLTNQALAIAVNREVVPRAKWREYRFAVGDKVDVVRAIGGG